MLSLGVRNAITVKDLFTKCNDKDEDFGNIKKVVLIVTEYVYDVEAYCKRIAGSNRFEEVLICCSVSEKAHRLHYKTDSRRDFTYAEYSKTLQLLSLNEYARDHDDDSTLETFVETEHCPIIVCPLFGTSASGLFGTFTMCAAECRATYPLTMSDCDPSSYSRKKRNRRGFDLVKSGVDAFLPEDDEEEKSYDDERDEDENIWDIEISDLRPYRVRQLKRVAHELDSFMNQNHLYLKEFCCNFFK